MQRHGHQHRARRAPERAPGVRHLPRQATTGGRVAAKLEAAHEAAARPRKAQRGHQLPDIAQVRVRREAATRGSRRLTAAGAASYRAAIELPAAAAAEPIRRRPASRAGRWEEQVEPFAEQLAGVPTPAHNIRRGHAPSGLPARKSRLATWQRDAALTLRAAALQVMLDAERLTHPVDVRLYGHVLCVRDAEDQTDLLRQFHVVLK